MILPTFKLNMLLVEHVMFWSQGNLRHWLEDPDCRDQYSVIYDSGERTGIFANDIKEPIEVEERAVSYNGVIFRSVQPFIFKI